MKKPSRFVDTNIFLAHIVFRPPQSHPATKFFERIWLGKETAETSVMVMFETAYTLETHYKLSKPEIRSDLLELLRLTNLHLPGRRIIKEALNLYAEYNVSIADAYHAVLMKSRRLEEIVSFDTDFDRLPGVKRVDPGDLLDEKKAA
jgi:predicted nucleic acid-binding protein